MKITLTLTDSQVARLRELDAAIPPIHTTNLLVMAGIVFKNGLDEMESRWLREIEALEEKAK